MGWDRVAARIVVVDDEDGLRDMVTEYLNGQGYAVRAADGGRELDTLLAEEPADLLVVDVNMPGEDGFSLARRIRASNTVPIIMLTAADDVIDRIVGLELGADDYVTKPFDLRELKARIGAVLRRRETQHAQAVEALPTHDPAPAPKSDRDTLVPFGKMLLDLEAHCLVAQDGAHEGLTAMEFKLLHAFANNPNRVMTRERLLDLAQNRDADPFDRSIDVRITRLRKKIENDPAKPQTIRTMRGVGYLFSPAQ
ncbi:response regulator [Corticibacterium sp. UT-5YL-CI-8]|nr:response regulator [Tianweitania sp. UT-5YL-CI-8]